MLRLRRIAAAVIALTALPALGLLSAAPSLAAGALASIFYVHVNDTGDFNIVS